MLLEYSCDLSGLLPTRDVFGAVLNPTPQPISFPSPELSSFIWDLSFDVSRMRFALSWEAREGSGSPLQTAGGTLVVSDAGKELWKLHLPAGIFPPAPSGVSRSARIDVPCPNAKLSLSLKDPLAPPGWDLPKLIEHSADSFTAQSPNNVRLYFPRTGRSLYANETFLANSSPYFKMLFEAGFSEVHETYLKSDEPPARLPEYTFDDSDEETDNLVGALNSSSNDTPSLPCKTITITETAYSTYFAVLVWLVTGRIDFLPVRACRSMRPPRNRAHFFRLKGSEDRKSALKNVLTTRSKSLPPPVPAKSIRAQLAPSNAAHLLYSDIAAAYPDVHTVALNFAVENWRSVSSALATTEMETLADGGGVDSTAAATAMKLARRPAGRMK
ncbi:hypothetical protein JCM10296v2_001057 [Rhodotorula toruloides]